MEGYSEIPAGSAPGSLVLDEEGRTLRVPQVGEEGSARPQVSCPGGRPGARARQAPPGAQRIALPQVKSATAALSPPDRDVQNETSSAPRCAKCPTGMFMSLERTLITFEAAQCFANDDLIFEEFQPPGKARNSPPTSPADLGLPRRGLRGHK